MQRDSQVTMARRVGWFCAIGAAVGLVPAMPTLAQSKECPGGPPRWVADSRTGCRVANICPQLDETVLWSGTCVAGLADGKGMLHWYRGGEVVSWYEGEMRRGMRNGRGTLTVVKGNRYEGDFVDDVMEGRGTLTYANGGRYEGEWKQGRPDGVGKATLGRHTFEGTWDKGCFIQGQRAAAIGAATSDCEAR